MKYILFALAVSSLGLVSTTPLHAHDVAGEMAVAANDFLSVLSDEQKAKATYKLVADERENWHFIPKPFEGEGMRGGLPLKEMRGDQQHLAHALLSTGMSHRGYTTALQIMSLEHVLWELENHAAKRQPEMYYVSIFGKPGSKAWGWRVEGHHISMNFSIADGKLISGTPSFFASNPAEVREGPRKGLRVLAAEEDTARSLVNSLNDEQKKAVMIADTPPRDVLTAAEREVSALAKEGIKFPALDDSQKQKLHDLINVYVRRVRPEIANETLDDIKNAGMENLIFAWAGGTAKGDPHYYRVQGPTFVLEYANTQNDANHVHAVWRDFKGDFGRDILAEHYAKHKVK